MPPVAELSVPVGTGGSPEGSVVRESMGTPHNKLSVLSSDETQRDAVHSVDNVQVVQAYRTGDSFSFLTASTMDGNASSFSLTSANDFQTTQATSSSGVNVGLASNSYPKNTSVVA